MSEYVILQLLAQLSSLQLYPLVAPKKAMYPYMTYRVMDVLPLDQLNGVPVGYITSYEIAVVASDYGQLRDMANDVRDKLDGWYGTIGVNVMVPNVGGKGSKIKQVLINIRNIDVTGFTDNYTPVKDSGDVVPYSATISFDVMWDGQSATAA